ncbi:MAG: repressor LexA [Sphingobacteriia bacterium]|nr:repressor LexA [Sphingobacteriia bacterium]
MKNKNRNMQILTPKQKIVLQAIKSYYSEHGMMPTIREIKDEAGNLGLKLKSIRSFFNYLNELEEKGYIQRTSEDRGIKLKGITQDTFVDIPILGMANAGTALTYADQYIEGYLKVSKSIVRDKNVFAVQISGTSMNKAKVNNKIINDGDFVLVEKRETYDYNDKVLVIIDGLATVKIYRKFDDDNIVLAPDSTDKKHKPIFLTSEDNFVIDGKVVEVLKIR